MIDKLTRLVEVFHKHGVRYLFIGKGAAILYGYPGTTQDIDIFPKKSEENCKNLVEALIRYG
jgi:radical SAM superfamily enzyme with C-terminal helix-hairpin-helix motif